MLASLPDDDVRDAMARLSDGFRTVLYYADVEGYTYAETAADDEHPDRHRDVTGVAGADPAAQHACRQDCAHGYLVSQLVAA